MKLSVGAIAGLGFGLYSIPAVALFMDYQVTKPATVSCSSTGTYALKNHTQGNGATYPSAPTLDCSSAVLFVTIRTWFSTAPTGGPNDNGNGGSGNTYSQIGTAVDMGDGTKVDLWYAVGTASSTFEWGYIGGGAGSFGNAAGACFTLSSGTATLDQHNQTGTSNQPGSVTPTVNGALLVTGYVPDDTVSGSTLTINNSFTIVEQASHGSDEGLGLAYLIQNPCAAINPTWTVSNGTKPGAANIGTFK